VGGLITDDPDGRGLPKNLLRNFSGHLRCSWKCPENRTAGGWLRPFAGAAPNPIDAAE
jgi:hypothetical protein